MKVLELRLGSLGSDINSKFFLTIHSNGNKNLLRVVFEYNFNRKYTGQTSNTVTKIKDRTHKDCIKSKSSTTIILS